MKVNNLYDLIVIQLWVTLFILIFLTLAYESNWFNILGLINAFCLSAIYFTKKESHDGN